MIKQVFDIEFYWKVIVYYNMDYNFFDDVALEMRMASISERIINEVWDTLSSGEAQAVTCNSLEQHISIIIFNSHTSEADYINSIVHEATHVMQAMLRTYKVKDEGEPPAYTVGYIVMKMYEVFKQYI